MEQQKLLELRAIRDSFYLQLKNTYDIATAAMTNASQKPMFFVRHEQVPSIYTKIQTMHAEIISLVAVQNSSQLEKEHDYMRGVDDTFYSIQELYHELFVQTEVPSQANTNKFEINPSVRLPKRNLRTFDGKLEDWTAFIQCFQHSIHDNKHLADIDKFEYLINCLSGEPFNLVKSLRLSNENYSIAYNKLLDRYENKRELATHYWHKLYNIPKLKDESGTGLKNVFSTFKENLDALQALKIESLENFVLFNILLDKLDPQTRRVFESEIRGVRDIPSYEKLCDFIEGQCRVLANEKGSSDQKQSKPNHYSRQNATSHCSSFVANSSEEQTCIICKQDHLIYGCPSFKAMPPEKRFNLIKTKRWCVNCLKAHSTQSCPSQVTCRTCQKKHHSLLHFNKSKATMSNDSNAVNSNLVESTASANTPIPNTQVSSVNSLASSTSRCKALLSTAFIEIRDFQGSLHKVRALIDNGSEASFMSSKCARLLNLPEIKNKIQITGVGASSAVVSSASVNCQISPCGSSNITLPLYAHIIPQVSAIIPSHYIQPEGWDHITHLRLADPEFYIPRPVDLLLGADIYAQILTPGIIVAPNKGMPSAINTMFGWVLSGSYQSKEASALNAFHTVLSENLPEDELNRTLKQFWEVEEVPTSITKCPEDDLCDRIYSENYKRLQSGRFVVPLPFREEKPSFPNSKDIAIRRFLAIERRLKSDPLLQAMYVEFMKDYLNEGHMEPVLPNSDPHSYYIPHHCVLKPDAVTTKLRVVFDASSKASNNLSLNDTLFKGPPLQNNIVDILLRFRLHKVVFISDIKQMYRQIQVDPQYRDYQKIIWRFKPDETLSEYVLTTVTYGVASSPYLALRTIRQLADDGQQSFPLASEVIRRDIYIDDIITGCDSLNDALDLQSQIIQLMQSGGFPLRKWSSNSPAFLEPLPADHCQSPFTFGSDPSLTIKVLGLQWTPSSDTFTYHFNPISRSCTKRFMLSELAKVFDPMGFLSPVTFYIKRLIQSLWCSGIGWDEHPPSDISEKWQLYKTQILDITNISITRQVIPDREWPCQLHGFCDASLAGYACAVFLRTHHNGQYVVRLVMAKSKVAPTSSPKMTIPRLELCGAVMLSKLMSLIKTTYSKFLNITDIYAWTDSSIVLSWVRSPSYRWKQYVSRRVAYIQERIEPSSWHHVSSSDNPADCASRGLLPSQLANHILWWTGPSWLALPSDQWPQSNISNAINDSLHEEERSVTTFVAQVDTSMVDQLFTKFSSLKTICHIATYLFRFSHNCRHPTNHIGGPISKIEFHGTLLKLVKLVQGQVFHKELIQLKNNQVYSKNLRRLNLFIDDEGIIRVGGRLRHANLPYEHKFPALLPQQHRLTSLIIEYTHQMHMHPGLKTLHYLLLQNFWILSAPRAIRKCLSNCYKCFRVNPRPLQPPMGDLPAFRVQQLRAFLSVGVDFGGPFTITMNRVRGAKTMKAYLCLFICLTTRAVHLEVVSDLSSEAFLAALRRFIARRGCCTTIYSDCGTNFVGASRQLLQLCESAATDQHITWKFNPPSAPHFGGIWEAGIKSVKTHLARVIGDQILTFEELHTVFVQIEALLNSRPLSPLSSDPNDITALTPGHFLTMSPLTSFPEPDLTNIQSNRLKRWQLLQQMHQHFWYRWRNEYLHTLQQRAKWTKPPISIEIGTLVLIKDDLLPPLQWRLGRIVQVHPGSDNVVRVVTVKTTSGTFKRPVVKLCPLPSSY